MRKYKLVKMGADDVERLILALSFITTEFAYGMPAIAPMFVFTFFSEKKPDDICRVLKKNGVLNFVLSDAEDGRPVKQDQYDFDLATQKTVVASRILTRLLHDPLTNWMYVPDPNSMHNIKPARVIADEIKTKKKQMEAAVSGEKYEEAAKLRDEIKELEGGK